jgi:hypothetical protein
VRRVAVLITLVGGLILGVVAAAQTRPDFSGRWTIVGSDKDARMIGGHTVTFGSSLLRECTASQDATSLVFQDSGHGTLLAIAFDGSDTRGKIAGEPGREFVWKAHWEDSKLVVATRVEPPRGGAASVRQVLSFDREGALVLEYQQQPDWPVITFKYRRQGPK